MSFWTIAISGILEAERIILLDFKKPFIVSHQTPHDCEGFLGSCRLAPKCVIIVIVRIYVANNVILAFSCVARPIGSESGLAHFAANHS